MPWTTTPSGEDAGFENDYLAVEFLTYQSPLTRCCLTNLAVHCVNGCGSQGKPIAGRATRRWTHSGSHSRCSTTQGCIGKPVDTTGEIIDSGDAALDGKVANAIELIQKLANSQRAEQVFVRHAFRFWMGRNETINDAPVLQDAYRAYKAHGGSMKALLVSLLTSDAFLYRTRRSQAVDTKR